MESQPRPSTSAPKCGQPAVNRLFDFFLIQICFVQFCTREVYNFGTFAILCRCYFPSSVLSSFGCCFVNQYQHITTSDLFCSHGFSFLYSWCGNFHTNFELCSTSFSFVTTTFVSFSRLAGLQMAIFQAIHTLLANFNVRLRSFNHFLFTDHQSQWHFLPSAFLKKKKNGCSLHNSINTRLHATWFFTESKKGRQFHSYGAK